MYRYVAKQQIAGIQTEKELEILDGIVCFEAVNVKHFFTSFGKQNFTSYGKDFFTWFGKVYFTSHGKQFFTLNSCCRGKVAKQSGHINPVS